MKIVLFAALAATLLQATDALFDAARRGDVAAVRAALEAGVPVDGQWRYGQTALFIAAGRGHTEVVRLLLDRGARADVKDTFYGATALQFAVDKNAGEIVEMLLAKGASGGGEPLLLAAAGKGKTAVVRVLLKQPGWSAKVLSHALASAEAAKHAETAAALRESGAKPPPEVDVATLERLRGRYASMPHQREIVTVEPQGGLIVIKGESMSLEYRPLDRDTFEPVRFPGRELIRFKEEGGRVTGAEFNQGGLAVTYKKLEDQQP